MKKQDFEPEEVIDDKVDAEYWENVGAWMKGEISAHEVKPFIDAYGKELERTMRYYEKKIRCDKYGKKVTYQTAQKRRLPSGKLRGIKSVRSE